MIFYTGSYTNDYSPALNPVGLGIACLDIDLKTGKVKLLHVTALRNPSYLTISDQGKYLYAIEELPEAQKPHVFCFEIAENGQLSLINSQALIGDYACHLTLVADQLIVANYETGNALTFPVLPNGGLEPHHQLIQHHGNGSDMSRQKGSHVHMAYRFGDDCFYLLDLGIDKANAYRLNIESKKWLPASELHLSIDPGAGARHMVINASETLAFVLSEMSGEVFVFNKQETGFEQIQKIAIQPEGSREKPEGAAIRLHPNGRFLYTSDRGSDTIGIFKLDEIYSTLSLVGHQSSGGKSPRDFNIDPTGNWLIVANQDGNYLVVFKVDLENGLLNKNSSISIGTPVNICWGNVVGM